MCYPAQHVLDGGGVHGQQCDISGGFCCSIRRLSSYSICSSLRLWWQLREAAGSSPTQEK